jgi:hypothetical protein
MTISFRPALAFVAALTLAALTVASAPFLQCAPASAPAPALASIIAVTAAGTFALMFPAFFAATFRTSPSAFIVAV